MGQGIREDERCFSYLDRACNGVGSLQFCNSDTVPDRPALHKDDRMVPILALDCCRKPGHIACLRSAHHLFKATSGDVVAFIHNDLSIPFDYRVYRLLMDQALQDGNIDQSSLLLLAGSNLSKRPRRRFEEQLQTIDPLIHQLPRMNKHQSAHSPTSDQPGCNNRLAEGRRGHQNARIMLQYSLRCLALQLGELPMELQVQGTSLNALVIYDHGGSQCFQEFEQFSHATARQGDVLGEVFRTTDYPGFTVSR